MYRKNNLMALALAVALAGCTTTTVVPPPSPTVTPPVVGTGIASPSAQRAVFTAKAAYTGMLTAAVTYKELRRCSATVPQPCSDPAIIAQLQKADIVTAAALDAAEAAVRTPQIGNAAVDAAVATANSALAALSALVSTLGVK